MDGRSWRIILNGGRDPGEPLREAVKRQRELGRRVDVRVTWESGDAGRYAREAVADGIDTVIAAGGDGTLGAVAGALAECEGDAEALPALGLLPLGTGNDFGAAAGIPDELGPALAVVAAMTPRPIDLGRIGERWFINIATGGYGSEVTAETPDELKRNLGRLAYLFTGLSRSTGLRSAHGRFHGNGFEWEGDFLALGIGNARSAGGGQVLCPDARIDDGLLDLAILPTPPEGQMGEAVRAFLAHGRDAIYEAMVTTRLARLQIEAEEGMHLNLDGEPLRDDRFDVRVEPGRLRMHLPKGCALLAG